MLLLKAKPLPVSTARPLLWLLLGVLVLTLLNGCGWHLRGTNMTVINAVVYVQNEQASAELKRELIQGLNASQVRVASDVSAADLVLVLHADSQGRRVLSVDQVGAASEFELQYQITYSVQDGEGKTLIPRDMIRVQRDYRYNQDEVLAKAKEERMLFDFMRRAAAQKLMRQLQRVADTAVLESPSHAN